MLSNGSLIYITVIREPPIRTRRELQKHFVPAEKGFFRKPCCSLTKRYLLRHKEMKAIRKNALAPADTCYYTTIVFLDVWWRPQEISDFISRLRSACRSWRKIPWVQFGSVHNLLGRKLQPV